MLRTEIGTFLASILSSIKELVIAYWWIIIPAIFIAFAWKRDKKVKMFSFFIVGLMLLGSISALTLPADLRVSSVYYFPMDDGSGTNVKEAITGLYNGTISGTSQWNDGISGTCVNFTQSAQTHIDVAQIIISGTTGGTIAFWNKASFDDGIDAYFWDAPIGRSTFFFENAVSQGNLYKILDVPINGRTTTKPVQRGVWKHITITWTQTSQKYYVDGVLKDTFSVDIGTGTSTSNLIIGSPGGLTFSGEIDEWGYWNAPLNQANITRLYNYYVQTGANILTNSTIPAVPVLGNTSVYMNVTTNSSTNSDIVAVYFTIKNPAGINLINYSNGTTLGGDNVKGFEWHSSTFNISVNDASLGYWNWTIDVETNNTGEKITQNTGNFLISDSYFPQISVPKPLAHSRVSNNSINITLAITDNINLSSCWYSYNDGATNTTIGCSGAIVQSASAVYNVSIGAKDSWGNVNTTRILNVSFLYDNVPPELKIFSPNQTFTGITYVPVNISAWDELGDLSYCYYNVTRGASQEVINTPIANCNNTQFSVSGSATYVIHICVNDTNNNLNCSSATFTTTNYIPPPYVVGDSSGGGGGSIIQVLTEKVRVELCKPTIPKLTEAWNNYKADKTFANFKIVWFAWWNRGLCEAGASIIPV